MVEVCGRKMTEDNLKRKKGKHRDKGSNSLAIIMWPGKKTNLWEWNRRERGLCSSGQALCVLECLWKWEVCHYASWTNHLTSRHLVLQKGSPPITMIVPQLTCHQKSRLSFAVSGSTCERIFPTVPKKGERYVSVTYLEFHPFL